MKRNKVNKKNQVSYFDYSLLFMSIFIICFGVVMIYSASSYEGLTVKEDSAFFIKSQLKAIALGVVVSLIVMNINYHFYKFKFIPFAAYFGSIALVGLIFSPVAIEVNGAKRWIGIGGLSIQVCDVVKLGLIIFMAYIIDRVYRRVKNFWTFAICLLIVLAPAGAIIGVTSDLSSGIVIALIGIIMLFIVCPRPLYFVGVGGIGILVLVVSVLSKPYRIERFKMWLNPAKYPRDGGYQILQALYSLGSGGVFGKGLGKGVQKLGYVPEAQNDMIFTVICEELGVVGGICVILMFLFILWRCMIIANNAPDLYGAMLVIGVMMHIAVQSVINIAVVTNLIPNTGVPLPFLSCGGSSVLLLMIEISIVLSVSKRIRTE